MPKEWDSDAERRAKAHVPDDVRHVPKWRLALQMIDALRDWGLEPSVVLADAGYGETTKFRAGLEERELSYVVQVKGKTRPTPRACGPNERPTRERGARRSRATGKAIIAARAGACGRARGGGRGLMAGGHDR